MIEHAGLSIIIIETELIDFVAQFCRKPKEKGGLHCRRF
jgi:hypothetical protein